VIGCALNPAYDVPPCKKPGTISARATSAIPSDYAL
jgi:hypothetical protein